VSDVVTLPCQDTWRRSKAGNLVDLSPDDTLNS